MGRARRVFLLLYAASGTAALVYEVSWTRMLALQLGHTVAAASTVLAAFMGGLAVGAWIAGRFVASSIRSDVGHGLEAVATRDGLRTAPYMRVYAALEIVVAASALG